MALHEQSVGKTDEWYTPPEVFEALGCRFDMDVTSPGQNITPWIPANRFLTKKEVGTPWAGLIWMNAPFGKRNGLRPWLIRFFKHGNGVALTPDRTSAPWWQEAARMSDAVLFVDGKLKFIGDDGRRGKSPAQGTTLMAKGAEGVAALCRAQSKGLGYLMVRAGA